MERTVNNTIISNETEKFSQIESFVGKNGIISVNAFKQLKNGRNSQVYLVEKGNKKWIVKKYHRHKNDKRNRLDTEFGFLTFLTNNEVNHVAEPITFDIENNLGLFSYLPGEAPTQINKNLISQACEFIRKINDPKLIQANVPFPDASEACFSIISHINCIKKRVTRLMNIIPARPIQYDVSGFVQSKLLPSLNKITKDIVEKCNDKKLQENLQEGSKIISPSDFGFQNTLIDKQTVYFLDFEYAGMDDPAKLICDFGCHPEIPVKDKYLRQFKDSFYPWLEEAEDSIHRSEMLMPLYRLKWCCIMLNEFTSTGKSRRDHAGEMFDYENQLQKSKTYFSKYLY